MISLRTVKGYTKKILQRDIQRENFYKGAYKGKIQREIQMGFFTKGNTKEGFLRREIQRGILQREIQRGIFNKGTYKGEIFKNPWKLSNLHNQNSQYSISLHYKRTKQKERNI